MKRMRGTIARSFFRYLPLLLLAIAWEAAARLELVSSSALPPLSDVLAAGAAMIKDGELISNGASSLYRAAAGLALAILIVSVSLLFTWVQMRFGEKWVHYG